ncbi:MAG: hypothetical protein GY861_03115 [bacterium]|nr:hypothetical protein [bacterium]
MKNGISAPRRGKASSEEQPADPCKFCKREIIIELKKVFKKSNKEQNRVLAAIGLLISLK